MHVNFRRGENIWVWPAFVSIVLLAIAFLYGFINVGIFDHVDHGYNEGWNAYNSQALLDRQALYPNVGDLRATNYPPLSFYIVAYLTRITGDMIITGRVVALISLVVTAVNVGAMTTILVRDGHAGLISSLFLLLAFVVWFPTWVGIYEPQWIGHALQSTGALIILAQLRSAPRSTASVVIGSTVMFLGVMIKHNLVALPLAVWVTLFVADRKKFWTMTWFGATLGGAAAVLLVKVFDGNFIKQVVEHKRVLESPSLR